MQLQYNLGADQIRSFAAVVNQKSFGRKARERLCRFASPERVPQWDIISVVHKSHEIRGENCFSHSYMSFVVGQAVHFILTLFMSVLQLYVTSATILTCEERSMPHMTK